MKRTIIYGLTVSGLIPFIIGALYHLTPTALPQWGWLESITTYYGAVILSFLGGIQWGLSLPGTHQTASRWLILSNVVSLIAFTSLLVPSHRLSLVILVFGYVIALLIDLNILSSMSPMSGYRTLRILLTIAACLLIALSGW